MEFIIDEKQIMKIIRNTGISITVEELDLLTHELYKHVDYTRKESFHNGYEQGKFDQKIETMNG